MPVSVTTTVQVVGWHSWPGASGRRRYLANLHRHRFHVIAEVPVTHDDRDVEFHDLADVITDWWRGVPEDVRGGQQRDRGSCEAMACELARVLTARLGRPPILVSVGEDGESWATWRP